MNMRLRVKNLVRKYGTRDPIQLASDLGITIIRKPYIGTKGFFKKELRRKFIIINSTLPEREQQIIIAHELGHALFHSNNSSSYLHEYTLFPRGKFEIEANKFAAELLIDESSLDEIHIEDLSIKQIANFYGLPEQLVEYKFLQ